MKEFYSIRFIYVLMINLLLGLDRSTYCINFEQVCRICYDLGFNGIEIQPEHPEIWKEFPKCAKQINDIIESYNFKIGVHAPIKDLNMASYNERIRNITLNEIMMAESFAEKLNARYFLIHAGKNSFVSRSLMSKTWQKKAIEFCIDTISKILEKSTCKITLENMTWSEWRFSSKIKYLSKIFECFPIDSLYFTLDISHALERSRNFVKKLVNLFAERIISFHFGDFNIQKFIFEHIKINNTKLKNFEFLVLEPHTLPLSSNRELLSSLISKQFHYIKKELLP
ncbi:MAG: sugar phosphate isomerase/epimerase [Candidatus Lokiarchaeota archaeon]|nr:sugar phosphate isomerase/epimerase [Candidatus Lokiarchaeota archaeon]